MHVFLAVYSLSVVLLFPCMVMQLISGALYGFWMGFMVSWIATSLGQALAFLLGRYLFRPTVKSYLHNTWPTFPTIDAAIKREGWKIVCLLRLSPVLPYNVLNYALAITPVSAWVFTVASAVATLPWTALYVYLGTSAENLMELAQVCMCVRERERGGREREKDGSVHAVCKWNLGALAGACIWDVAHCHDHILSHHCTHNNNNPHHCTHNNKKLRISTFRARYPMARTCTSRAASSQGFSSSPPQCTATSCPTVQLIRCAIAFVMAVLCACVGGRGCTVCDCVCRFMCAGEKRGEGECVCARAHTHTHTTATHTATHTHTHTPRPVTHARTHVRR